MPTDYRKLCVDLFGTDDVAKLERIATELKTKNPRNAGRKKKFSPADVGAMEKQLAQGCTIQQVAEQFGTSRQIVAKYLNPKLPKGCTMRMTYMCGHRPCTLVDVDFLSEKVYVHNRTDDLLHRAFGVVENPTWADFQDFLKSRCFPACPGNYPPRL